MFQQKAHRTRLFTTTILLTLTPILSALESSATQIQDALSQPISPREEKQNQQETRCPHGNIFSALPMNQICCTPKDAYFDNVTIEGDLIVNGSTFINDLVISRTTIEEELIINELIVNGTAFINELIVSGSTVIGGTLCVEGDLETAGINAHNTIYAPYFSNLDVSMVNDTHREIFSNFDCYALTITATDATIDDSFGISVALNATGEYTVVGASDKNSFAGAAYVLARTATGWGFVQELPYPGSAPDQFFGAAVAISHDGSRIAVGANGVNSDEGRVYVYTKTGALWTLETILAPFDAIAGGSFGYSLSLNADGSRLLVGAPQLASLPSTGAVYSYQRLAPHCTTAAATWTFIEKINAIIPNSAFGYDVAYASDGLTAVIGAPNPAGNSAYVYTRTPNTSNLTLQQTLTGGAGFGLAVTINDNGNTIAVSAPLQIITPVTRVGLVSLFLKSNGVWQLQQSLFAPLNNNRFGKDISLSGDGNLIAITNDTQGNPGQPIGTAYLFARSCNSWYQIQSLSSSIPGGLTAYGSSVSLSKDQSFLAVGEPIFPTQLTQTGAVNLYGPANATMLGDVTVTGSLHIGDATTSLFSTGTGSLAGASNNTTEWITDGDGFRYFTNYRALAYLGLDQVGITSPGTLINLNIIDYDPHNNFNTVSHLYTPPVSGYYLINAHAEVDSTAGTSVISLILRVNGVNLTQYKSVTGPFGASSTNRGEETISVVLFLNAITDTLGLFITPAVLGDANVYANNTYLSIHLLSTGPL